MSFTSFFLVGGAGFVGSHFIDALLSGSATLKVTIFDNFSSGQPWHYQHHVSDTRFTVIHNDAKNLQALTEAMHGHDIVMHFASNPDISKAVNDPTIDFYEGILLTQMVLEATRLNQIKRLIYISGSGVYGDVGDIESKETDGSMHPVSTYGASKLAGEAFVSSYCHMFGLTACIFRFGNVVGARQTHGVGFDFIYKLMANPNELTILGDGLQSKSYVHVSDIINAVMLANQELKTPCEIYNVATGDYITVKQIAGIVVDSMGLTNKVSLKFLGGDRGWKGDVPVVRLNTDKIKSLGWSCQKNSEQAIKSSVMEMLKRIQAFKKNIKDDLSDHTTFAT